MTDHSAAKLDLSHAIETERLALCDFLDQLDEARWKAQPWRDAWTVREVVAHLTTSTRTGIWDMFKGACAARGDFDRMEREQALRLAHEFTPAELVGRLRSTAASTKRTPMSSPLDPLLDVIVHGQDIARPLQRPLGTQPDRVVAALDHAVGSRWYGATKRFAGLNLTANDIDWSYGQGTDHVHGAAIDLLLVATGRPQALTELTGNGVAQLTRRMVE